MKENEFLNGVSHIETDVVERFVSMDNELQEKAKKPKKGIWLRVGAIAACFMLIAGTVIAVHLLRNPGDKPINPPDNDVPSISTVTSGEKITGVQALEQGSRPSINGGKADILSPGFTINTVIEAEVIEVLPDTYYFAASDNMPIHIARLRVVDQIRGEGFPNEIFLYYPYYDTDVFDGYDCFIMSLRQEGVENYALVNGTQSRVDFFSNMFAVSLTWDLGYGSVIAFNDGEVDEGFWEKTDYLFSKSFIPGKNLSDFAHSIESYPASENTKISEVKSNIIELAKNGEDWHVSSAGYDYFTSDDIFVSEEAKAIKAYLEPSETNVFVYELSFSGNGERITAGFTRIINGFKTDETIYINGHNGDNGNVSRRGESYTAADLSKVPNIGETLEKLDLSELKPPHTEIKDGMYLKYANATGVYRKVDGKVYGIVRVIWLHACPEWENACIVDDCYYLYDENGTGSILERDELKEIIGDDPFIPWMLYKYPYNTKIMWHY